MKYMILLYGSQQDYDGLAGRPTDKPGMSPEDVAAIHALMESIHKDLTESGELVDARGLTAPLPAPTSGNNESALTLDASGEAVPVTTY